jgi:hypothetical protein
MPPSMASYSPRMKKKRFAGRPPLTPGEAMKATVVVRMRVREREAVEAAAARDGRRLSEWCRQALINASKAKT